MVPDKLRVPGCDALGFHLDLEGNHGRGWDGMEERAQSRAAGTARARRTAERGQGPVDRGLERRGKVHPSTHPRLKLAECLWGNISLSRLLLSAKNVTGTTDGIRSRESYLGT